jgi:hypothetical protein
MSRGRDDAEGIVAALHAGRQVRQLGLELLRREPFEAAAPRVDLPGRVDLGGSCRHLTQLHGKGHLATRVRLADVFRHGIDDVDQFVADDLADPAADARVVEAFRMATPPDQTSMRRHESRDAPHATVRVAQSPQIA